MLKYAYSKWISETRGPRMLRELAVANAGVLIRGLQWAVDTCAATHAANGDETQADAYRQVADALRAAADLAESLDI